MALTNSNTNDKRGRATVYSPIGTRSRSIGENDSDVRDTLGYIYTENPLEREWSLVDTDAYTTTPASSSTLTFNNTSSLAVGLSVKYRYDGTDYYGVINSINGSTVTIHGAPLDTGETIESIHIGPPPEEINFSISNMYGDDVENELLLTDMNTVYKWSLPNAYIVKMEATHIAADTGANQPKINMIVDGEYISNNDNNLGIQLSTAETWVQTTSNISTSGYNLSKDDTIEIVCTAAGSNGDAENLVVKALVVIDA